MQNLIVRGHNQTVLSALKCVDALDAGPVYLKVPMPLDGTADQILNRAAIFMESMIVRIMEERPEPVPQEGEIVIFRRRNPQDGNLADLKELPEVNDYIRMLDADDYPPAFLETSELRFEFKHAMQGDGYVDAHVRIRKKLR